MAKWGCGDPRWIVEERPDATNVNNWHWTEKNASQWSKDKLTELLLNLKIDESGLGLCEVTEVKSIEGEAVANNRKGKLIFFYEWVVKLKWKGRLNGDDHEINGEIEIPNLSEENGPEEVDVNVTIDSNDDTSEILKEMMRNKGTDIIREKIKDYIMGLRDDFAKDMIKPSKLIEGGTINSFTTAGQTSKSDDCKIQRNVMPQVNGKINNESIGVKVEMVTLTLNDSMKCTAEEFYRVFTTSEMVAAFTRSSAMLEPMVNGRFELFDKNVTGIFTHLEPNKCIKQKWRFKEWPKDHYSNVTIEIAQKDDCTDVSITQTEVPKYDSERTESGWKRNYFESMKRIFGFGVSLY